MLGNKGSRIATWLIGFLPMSHCHALKRFLLRVIGGIEVGEDTTIYSGARFNGRYIKIGSHCHIGTKCDLIAPSSDAWIKIGDWSSLGQEVFMTTGAHDMSLGLNHKTNGLYMPITIGEYCSLSVRSMVMPGICVGDKSYISPGVVVSKNIKPNSMVAPAVCRIVSKEE